MASVKSDECFRLIVVVAPVPLPFFLRLVRVGLTFEISQLNNNY